MPAAGAQLPSDPERACGFNRMDGSRVGAREIVPTCSLLRVPSTLDFQALDKGKNEGEAAATFMLPHESVSRFEPVPTPHARVLSLVTLYAVFPSRST